MANRNKANDEAQTAAPESGPMTRQPKPTKEITEMLDYYAAMNKRSREERKLAAKPEIGILFVYENQLWIDSTPVVDAEAHCGFKDHEKGHDAFWELLQARGTVPKDVEYIEVPRGERPLKAIADLSCQGHAHIAWWKSFGKSIEEILQRRGLHAGI